MCNEIYNGNHENFHIDENSKLCFEFTSCVGRGGEDRVREKGAGGSPPLGMGWPRVHATRPHHVKPRGGEETAMAKGSRPRGTGPPLRHQRPPQLHPTHTSDVTLAARPPPLSSRPLFFRCCLLCRIPCALLLLVPLCLSCLGFSRFFGLSFCVSWLLGLWSSRWVSFGFTPELHGQACVVVEFRWPGLWLWE